MVKSKPRLLVATEFPPNASGGGPAVVRQLLRPWPTSHLFWWSCLPERGKRFSQEVSEASGRYIPGKLMPQRRFTRLRSTLISLCWSPLAAAHLRKSIRRLKPDVVWAIPHNWSIFPLRAILPTSGIGFHVTMQDYADVHGQGQKFGNDLCRRMAAMADEVYAGATTRDATSHSMVKDLQRRTGVAAAQVLHAGLEDDDYRFLAAKHLRHGDAIRIAYAGTVLVPKEFALFVSALASLRSSLPLPVVLEFYGAHSYAGERWFDSTWMRERGNFPESELLAALRDCTWGFAPMALTDEDPRYNRFSFPTKFITYLAAGLPVITLGHPESSVMQMAMRYRVGPISQSADPFTIAEDLRSALVIADPWPHYRDEVARCARAEYDAERMRNVLFDCFDRCADHSDYGSAR
jgi:hypothetical protein